ncbi:MAG: sulfatase [Planctomycetaceae bacterium]
MTTVLLLCSAASAAPPDGRPNILFIFSDDHASHAMSCYGSKIVKTPNLDRIANEGMLFKNCFCTNSVCGPSRAVILTGKHSHLNGFYRNGNRFDGSQQTFPKLLQKAGYQTAIIGKWHLESDPTGFDLWKILIGQGPYYNPQFIENGQQVRKEGYTTDLIGDLTLEYLKTTRDPSKPFLLMCQNKAPHREWQPAPRHLTLFDDVTIPEPETLFDDYAGRGSAARSQEMEVGRHLSDLDLKLVPPKGLTKDQLAAWTAAYEPKNKEFRDAKLTGRELVQWKYQRYIKDYLRCVTAVDENVGRVLAYLDESGLAKNTIVIYSSDQGFYLGEHGWFDKRFMYEESYRQPFIVRWPEKIKPGSVNEDLVSNLDFAETFLAVAGVAVPPDMQGKSLLPLFEGKTPTDWRKSLYYHYYEYPAVHMVRKHEGVRTARQKLIHFYDKDLDEWEFYDLDLDPREMKSLYSDPSRGVDVTKLKSELARLREEYKVPVLSGTK